MDEKKTSDVEALIFRPSKVSWGLQKTLHRLNPHLERMTLISIVILLVSGLAWSYFSTQAIVVDATGEVTPVDLPVPIVSKSPMTIKRVLVSDNQMLEKSQIVLETTRHIPLVEIEVIEKIFNDLNNLLRQEKTGSCDDICQKKLFQIAEQDFMLKLKIEPDSALLRDVLEFNRALKDYSNQVTLTRSLPLMLKGLQNEYAITKSRVFQIRKRRATKILAMEYEELSSKLLSLKTQIKEKELMSKANLDNARTSYELNLARVTQSFDSYTKSSVIRSPVSGTIRLENIKGVGQVINPGELLFQIIKSSSDLWFKFKVSENDIAKVKPGLKARIDVSSYPASEFGVQKASIVQVLDKLPVADERLKTPYFIGHAKLESQMVHSKGKTYPLRSGMQGKVKITIKHERVLTTLVKKIFSIKEDIFGDFR